MGWMDLFGKKSPLVDCKTYLSNISGKLYGNPRMKPEGDFSVWFTPDDKSRLKNRNGVPNPNGMLELEVKVVPQYRQAFQEAVTAMAGQTVFASGVLINDDSKGSKAEIRPLDMLYAPLMEDKYPAWFQEIRKNLKDPNAVAVYKVVAASDASKSGRPPQADESRAMQATVPYPPKPNFPKIKIDFEVRGSVNLKTDFKLNNNVMRQRIELDLGVESAKGDGPGVFVGDLVAYWGNE
ncbi:MAG TPA: hypothetical protein VMV05_08585 [bacterium]|nr:hypothetical protein [bacterium]